MLAIHRSAIASARGAWTGALMIGTPAVVTTVPDAAVKLGVPVTDQELEVASMLPGIHQDVPGLLGHRPLPRRMSGDPGQVQAAGGVLDEQQHVQTPQQHGIDVEEARREDRLRLGLQECPPGLPGPPGCGLDPASLRICHTAGGASVCPSPASSPRMRR
jgi:hypothetical protein